MWLGILSWRDYRRLNGWIHFCHKLLIIGRHEDQSQKRGYNSGSRDQVKNFNAAPLALMVEEGAVR